LVSLDALKMAGALGLLVGIAMPLIRVAAAVGFILFFIGAIVTVVRALGFKPVPCSVPRPVGSVGRARWICWISVSRGAESREKLPSHVGFLLDFAAA
jgi:hypothetical protein